MHENDKYNKIKLVVNSKYSVFNYSIKYFLVCCNQCSIVLVSNAKSQTVILSKSKYQ